MTLLARLRVLDLTDEKASFCSKLLADVGAEVIKIERPGGDTSRRLGPFWKDNPHPENSLFFWYNNTNKLGITLDLENNEGRRIFLKLARQADVVIETFAPGYLDRIGLSYEVLSKKNRRLILASITDFGQTGPYNSYKSCAIVASALGGQMYVCGKPGAPPLQPYGQQPYYTASLFAAVGIFIALLERNRSGRGQHIDISLQEAVAATLDHVMVRYFGEKTVPTRQGSLHWTGTADLVPCQDGYILVSFDQAWETLVGLLDSEGMAADLKEKKWREENYRRQHAHHIIEVLASWTRTHTTDELFKLGQLMRLPWAPINSIPEVFHSPQLEARDFFISVKHPEAKTSFVYPGAPYKFSSSSLNLWQCAPFIGEDNTKVYHEELGFSREEMANLSATNVI